MKAVRFSGNGGAGATLAMQLHNGIDFDVPEGAAPAMVCGVLDALLTRT
ncbi:MAG: hypothetical protein U5S82_15020 [Gammaproteobacteria bacterium]|nr:hypothetical protein [Gammaproteobacteria bacterium]